MVQNSAQHDLARVRKKLGKPVQFLPKHIEFYPSFRCNAKCNFCFTDSGLTENGQLDPTTTRRLIRDAKQLGYHYVGRAVRFPKERGQDNPKS